MQDGILSKMTPTSSTVGETEGLLAAGASGDVGKRQQKADGRRHEHVPSRMSEVVVLTRLQEPKDGQPGPADHKPRYQAKEEKLLARVAATVQPAVDHLKFDKKN